MYRAQGERRRAKGTGRRDNPKPSVEHLIFKSANIIFTDNTAKMKELLSFITCLKAD
jgi:hypothetical protein